MFIVFGGGYHVFMVANRIGFVFSYMLVHETYFCRAVSILESRILWMKVGYAFLSLKFYRSCEVFAKLISVGYTSFNNTGLICTVMLCLMTGHY